MAAGRACAAARAGAAHRHTPARNRGRSGISGPRRGVPAGAGAIGLDHRPQRAHRHSVGRGQRRRGSQTRSGTGHGRAGRHLGPWRLGPWGPLLQATRTVPIVFPVAGDPVAAGFVASLAQPGGNATGCMSYEFSLSGKRLELLKQIAPGVTRAAVLRDPTQGGGTSEFAVIQAMAPSLRVEVNPINTRDAGEIERAVAAFGRSPNGGLIVNAGGAATLHRNLIITLAARHKLPTVYYERFYVAAGGLVSYGPNYVEQYERAAGYVDRILKGEKPADLPVQAPTKYELVINLKTAKTLGLEVPPALLARADEVIE